LIKDGQTGSGKTYCMLGNNVENAIELLSSITDNGENSNPNQITANNVEEECEEVGIIPRAIMQTFQLLNYHLIDNKSMASIRVSMIEIYNDECRDLLHPEIPSRDVMIREDKHGRIFFTGAREEIVSNASMAIQYLQKGTLNRTTAETLMNQSSSRSHAIFTISLEMIEYPKDENGIVIEGDAEGSFIHAKLHLVDLAGSERAKRTGASGTRFKESVGINQVCLPFCPCLPVLFISTRFLSLFLNSLLIGFTLIRKSYSSINIKSYNTCSIS
jgi:hypothetical protein